LQSSWDFIDLKKDAVGACTHSSVREWHVFMPATAVEGFKKNSSAGSFSISSNCSIVFPVIRENNLDQVLCVLF
jgi:hypothetical protein